MKETAYALALLLLGCVGYVLGVAHEKYEQAMKRRGAQERKQGR